MMLACFTKESHGVIPIHIIDCNGYASWFSLQSNMTQQWANQHKIKPTPGSFLLCPSAAGCIESVVYIKDESPFSFARLYQELPPHTYKMAGLDEDLKDYYLAFGLESYTYDRFKKCHKTTHPTLVIDDGEMWGELEALLDSIFFIRDLINAPANHMGPQDLCDKGEEVAVRFGAKVLRYLDKQLPESGFPAVYEVGRGSARPPQVLEFTWGNPRHPRLALVGKGVCFDSGGYDLKSPSNMLLMKKDMGGAAHALGLAQLIMTLKLPVHLHVLIPAVENSVSGNAYRPLDIIKTRKGLSVEIGDTDAEGRLILADALAAACEKKPHLVMDFSTLTGAARVALGTEIAAYFTPDEDLAARLMEASKDTCDPLWRLPLFPGYNKHNKTTFADLTNAPKTGLGGAITAALFLQNFVEPTTPWVHFDMMAYNVTSTPGKPEGGEAMAIRASLQFLQEWVSTITQD